MNKLPIAGNKHNSLVANCDAKIEKYCFRSILSTATVASASAVAKIKTDRFRSNVTTSVANAQILAIMSNKL